jgi:hypothetical protein
MMADRSAGSRARQAIAIWPPRMNMAVPDWPGHDAAGAGHDGIGAPAYAVEGGVTSATMPR